MDVTEARYNNERGPTASEAVDQDHTAEQSDAVWESTTEQVVEQPAQTAESFGAKPEEEPEDQRLSVSSEQSEMVSSYHEKIVTDDRISTSSASLGGFHAAAATEDDSEISGMAYQANQQSETLTQPDPETSDLVTSPEPEMETNSGEVLAPLEAQQEPAATSGQISSTPSTPEIELEQREMKVQVDSQLDVRSSLSDQSAHGTPEALTAQAPEHLPGLVRTSGASEKPEDQPCGAVDEPVRTQLDEALVRSEESEPTSATLLKDKLESCCEEMTTSAAAEERTICAGEKQSIVSATDSTSPHQCDEPAASVALSDHELRSSVTAARSGTETVEPRTFTFPEPPRQPYDPLAVSDVDVTDDVFVEHSSGRNDPPPAGASQEILRAPATMTSSTPTAAAESLDVSRQQQPRADESLSAGVPPLAPPQPPPCEEEAVPSERPPTPGGPSHEARIPPTSDAPAAAATAPPPKDAGVKSGDEIQADAPPNAEKLKSLSSEPSPSSGDFLTATKSTEAADRQSDEVPAQQSDQQQSSGTANRRQLSLLIPGQDADLHAADNQVSVCTHSSEIVRTQITNVSQNLSALHIRVR